MAIDFTGLLKIICLSRKELKPGPTDKRPEFWVAIRVYKNGSNELFGAGATDKTALKIPGYGNWDRTTFSSGAGWTKFGGEACDNDKVEFLVFDNHAELDLYRGVFRRIVEISDIQDLVKEKSKPNYNAALAGVRIFEWLRDISRVGQKYLKYKSLPSYERFQHIELT